MLGSIIHVLTCGTIWVCLSTVLQLDRYSGMLCSSAFNCQGCLNVVVVLLKVKDFIESSFETLCRISSNIILSSASKTELAEYRMVETNKNIFG